MYGVSRSLAFDYASRTRLQQLWNSSQASFLFEPNRHPKGDCGGRQSVFGYSDTGFWPSFVADKPTPSQKKSQMARVASENSCRENYATLQDGIETALATKKATFATPLLAPLLISVRDQTEAALVSQFPFEVLDLKEPNNGPLGACDPAVWHYCVESTPLTGFAIGSDKASCCEPSSGRAWSVAMGERANAVQLARHVPAKVRFAKAGPSGLPDTPSLIGMWDRLLEQLAEGIELVAVAYADWRVADSLQPEQILGAAASIGLKTILIDTFDKKAGGVFELLGQQRIESIVQTATSQGCEVVLAGGITFSDATRAFLLGCRRIGLRGALCRGPRNGEIDPQSVGRWCETFQQ